MQVEGVASIVKNQALGVCLWSEWFGFQNRPSNGHWMVGGCQIYHPLREICCHLSQIAVTTLQSHGDFFSLECMSHRLGWGNIPTSQQFDDSSVDGDLFFGWRNHPNSMVRLLSRNNVLIAWRMILVPPTNLRGGALGALGALNIDSSSDRLLQVATATGSGWKQVGAPLFGLCTGRWWWWWWRWSESFYGGERVMFSTFFRMFLFFLSRWGMFGYTILVLLNLKDRMTLRKGSWLRLIRWNWMEKGSSFPGLQGWIHIGIKFGTLFLMFGCYLRGPAKWLWMAIFPMKHFTSATPINCIQEKRQIQ